jgi:hypothetical protein
MPATIPRARRSGLPLSKKPYERLVRDGEQISIEHKGGAKPASVYYAIPQDDSRYNGVALRQSV